MEPSLKLPSACIVALLVEFSLTLKLPDPAVPLVPLAVMLKLPDPVRLSVKLLEPVESEMCDSMSTA
jgi:hypothetical protein